ncbi:ATP-binding cassette sub-family D member 2 [Wickerhamiella sorbophila]|uniref:ATP-binding cassette sub-family D member 2 n=1 Tax=Wickerhamiella sorbophila TaxID=45607 RepID=A0A2T0FBS8_9ASCO|nr:ATP-binding cassette sub-family D member 2 [Wickerhamiella sorbophila]PRT52458.1 ATP-binding cassette sub-family D member 2 [Wickerhamiella sorbophila]
MANLSKLATTGLGVYKQHRTAATRVMYLSYFLVLGYRLFKPKPVDKDAAAGGKQAEVPGRKKRVAIDQVFFNNLLRILKIIIPDGIRSREFMLLCLETVFLVLRSAISLYVAYLDGKLVSHLVKGEGTQFMKSVLLWLLVGFPASFTNSILSYLRRKLSLRFRSRLNGYMLKEYLPDSNIPIYYLLQNMDDRIKNADQVMTSDIARFSASLSNLYSNLAKPILDMFLYTWQLSKGIGGDNVFFIGLAIQMSAAMLRLSAPPFGEFVAKEANLQGDFRAKHTRLIEYSEEIALYGGNEAEKDILDTAYFALSKHVNRVLRHRLIYNFSEDFVIKYYWGALGLVLCSIPVFFKDLAGQSVISTVSQRTSFFVTNRRFLVSGSDAFGRITSSYKEISQLAGYTSRVSTFMNVMDDVKRGKFEKSFMASDSEDDFSDLPPPTVRLGHDIIFDNVPIVSPIGDVLIRQLCFQVKQGQHLLIVGPNGCGKSSLFRILGGLWQIRAGLLVRPPASDIFYIPQRPYMSKSTLRQLVIYPTTEDNNTVSDAELREILDILEIGELVDHFGGWNTVKEWREELSMGVQQRIAAARLFYHKPKFAILDECTSSVTLDTETVIYTHAKELGISLLTVSHRASLWKYHNLILHFDGYGGYVFTDLDADERLKLEEEKLAIDYELRHEEETIEKLRILEQAAKA